MVGAGAEVGATTGPGTDKGLHVRVRRDLALFCHLRWSGVLGIAVKTAAVNLFLSGGGADVWTSVLETGADLATCRAYFDVGSFRSHIAVMDFTLLCVLLLASLMSKLRWGSAMLSIINCLTNWS